MAHIQFSQKSFFQITDIMHHWRALSIGLADEQSKLIIILVPRSNCTLMCDDSILIIYMHRWPFSKKPSRYKFSNSPAQLEKCSIKRVIM